MKENKKKTENINKNKDLLIVVVFCFVFFILSSILPYWQKNQGFLKFFSPDENANYVFTKLYKESGKLYIFEKYNLIAEEIVKPRSYFSYQGLIKPVSFLGIIIIYGSVAKIFGLGVIPFLTPILASLGLFFYYLLIKELFGKKNALASFFLLFSFPVWIYYSARSMFHNVLFTSFFIIATYFLVILFKKYPTKFLKSEKDYCRQLFGFDFLYSALSGFFIGLAIAVRSSELIWLAPAGLVLLILMIRKLSFFRFGIFISFIFLGLLPVFYHNQILYNSPFYGGYYEMNKSIEDIGSASGGLIKSFFSWSWVDIKNFSKVIFNTIFYFGFYPRQSIQMFGKYCVEMFWYLFWPFIAGLFYAIIFKRKILRKIWPYGLAWITLSLILIFYYGSWKFVDNPDPSRFTIGNSYTRYWLPIYIGLLPFASILILNFHKIFYWVKNKIFQKMLKIFFPLILLIFIIFLSFRFVYSGSEEGLKHYFGKTHNAQYEVGRVLELTENNAVIITEYHDKFLFPERKIIVGRFNDDNMNKNYLKLVNQLPVYYYNFTLPEKDLEYLNNRRLKDFGLRIELVENVNESFSLYKLHRNYDL